MDNVLPHVAEALVIIHRDKIEDPVYFMSNFLRKRGEELEVGDTISLLLLLLLKFQ